MPKIPPRVLEHKTLALAMLLLARDIGEELGIEPGWRLLSVCERLGANRTSVYEQRGRIIGSLDNLASASPGPPARIPESSGEDARSLRLTIEVLDYQASHPGAVITHRSRSAYSPEFRRFVLELCDGWSSTLEALAQAVRVPLDTLQDWRHQDRLPETRIKERPTVPVDASEMTRKLVELWEHWQGSTRSFIAQAPVRLGLTRAKVIRLLRIFGIISPRSGKEFRYRGATRRLSPGMLLVTDGKQVTIELTASQSRTKLNWQGIVDQPTGTHTAVVVSDEEDAATVKEAVEGSLATLSGVIPVALLHDGKPCYQDKELCAYLENLGIGRIWATEGRGENKAIVEGAFGLWEQQVGSIVLDDSSPEALIATAAREVIRAYVAGRDSVPHPDFKGKSRLAALQQACPSAEQQARDLDFIRQLSETHDRERRWPRRRDAVSRRLLDEVFERLDLLGKDPFGRLRGYLSGFESQAIRRAAAVVSAKLQGKRINREFAHRYLAKVIRNQQQELELERAEQELLVLCEAERQIWTALEEDEYQALIRDRVESSERLCAVAERAAHGGIPLQNTFWTAKLLEAIHDAGEALVERVRKHLVRLFEAPVQRRLALLDLIAALRCDLPTPISASSSDA
jgi:hypothetical protein